MAGADVGAGPAVVFQHGLGGDEAQVAEVFPASAPFRRLTLECRAHGRSDDCATSPYSLESFSDDVLAFADERGIDRFVVGGISMGAAIALRLAVKHPDRVSALVLARPAWLWDSSPLNMRPFGEVAARIVAAGATNGLKAFERSGTASFLQDAAPDNLASLRKFFARPRPEVTAKLLASISSDGPGVTKEQVAAINVPTLVIAHGRDYVHPLEHGKVLAETIPGAEFVEITPKATDKARYVAEFSDALLQFLTKNTRTAAASAASGEI
ncbi:alpha/beta fold hydrolase [Burkholderia sp. MR1-5-21]